MRKQPKPPAAAEQSDVAKLAAVVDGLKHQVRELALILDEVREELIWAVRNDKFYAAGHSTEYVDEELGANTGEEHEPSPVGPPPVRPTSPARQERSLFE